MERVKALPADVVTSIYTALRPYISEIDEEVEEEVVEAIRYLPLQEAVSIGHIDTWEGAYKYRKMVEKELFKNEVIVLDNISAKTITI